MCSAEGLLSFVCTLFDTEENSPALVTLGTFVSILCTIVVKLANDLERYEIRNSKKWKNGEKSTSERLIMFDLHYPNAYQN